jgi:hypothetical protein
VKLLPLYVGSLGAGSFLLASLALRTGQSAAEPVAYLGLLSTPLLLLLCLGLGGGRWPRCTTRTLLGGGPFRPAGFYLWSLLLALAIALVVSAWVLQVGAVWLAVSSLAFRFLLGTGCLVVGIFQACLVGFPLAGCANGKPSQGLTGGALAITGLAWGGSWIRLLLVAWGGPEGALGAVHLDNVVLWLLLLALGFWWRLDRRLFREAGIARLRILYWMGLTLGFALPLLLLDRGGRMAEVGALLALTGGLSTVAVAVGSSEASRPF